VFTLVVTSAVIPIPREWNSLDRVRIAVSVDGLPPEHDVRRAPATYERILRNIENRVVDISWAVINPMLTRPGYLDEYLEFWTRRPEIGRVWLSLYTPQKRRTSNDIPTPESRQRLLAELPRLKTAYPALILPDDTGKAFAESPKNPATCTFSRISVNYSADLRTRIEPCFFGGNRDCSQCEVRSQRRVALAARTAACTRAEIRNGDGLDNRPASYFLSSS
jgi:MoaA/NifB/PqqE/SkfB family radical SAM enzyme